MASIISSVDNIVESLIVTSPDYVFPEYGSIIFFLLLFVIFSITFASTAFIPVFKGENKMNNIRTIISFSIAFLSSIFYFNTLTQIMLFSGVWLVLSFFSSFVIMAVIPKDKREASSKTVVITCAIVCLVLTIIIFMNKLDALLSLLDPVAELFSSI